MDAIGFKWLLAQQQCGLEERAIGHAVAHRVEVLPATKDQFSALAQQGHTLCHVGLLRV